MVSILTEIEQHNWQHKIAGRTVRPPPVHFLGWGDHEESVINRVRRKQKDGQHGTNDQTPRQTTVTRETGLQQRE